MDLESFWRLWSSPYLSHPCRKGHKWCGLDDGDERSGLGRRPVKLDELVFVSAPCTYVHTYDTTHISQRERKRVSAHEFRGARCQKPATGRRRTPVHLGNIHFFFLANKLVCTIRKERQRHLALWLLPGCARILFDWSVEVRIAIAYPRCFLLKS